MSTEENDDFDFGFSGTPGTSAEDAAHGIVHTFKRFRAQIPKEFGTVSLIMFFNEAALSNLGYQLEVFFQLWKRLVPLEVELEIYFTEEFECEAEAMARLMSTASYVNYPLHRVRPIAAFVEARQEEFRKAMEKFQRSMAQFIDNCAMRGIEVENLPGAEHPECN